MSWSKESTIVRAALVACGMCVVVAGCSDSNDNSWNLFAKNDERRVEPTKDPTSPPKPATANKPAATDNTAAGKTVAPESNAVDKTPDRGNPTSIEQYAANLQPSNRQPAGRGMNNTTPTVASNNAATVNANNDGTNSTSMSPVRVASDRNDAGFARSQPLTNDTAPRRNNAIPSGANSAADSSTSSNTLITPVRPTSSLDDANAADNRPKYIDNDELANRRTTNSNSTQVQPAVSSATENAGAPKLSSVTVENARPTTNRPIVDTSTQNSATKNPPTPASNPQSATRQREIAEQESKVAANPTDVLALFKLRTLYLLDGRESDAYAPMEGIPADTQAIVQAQLRSMASVQAASPNDSATWANRQLEAMRNLQEKLRAQADLQVPKVVICTDIEAFGKYTPFESTDFEAGYEHLMVLYFEVDNFKTEQTAGGQYRSKFAVRVDILDEKGEIIRTFEDPVVEDMNRRPRRDFFMHWGPFSIPAVQPPGDYTIKVQIDDLLAGKTNSNKTTFRLVP